MKYISILIDLMRIIGWLSLIIAFAYWLFTELPNGPLPGRSLFDKQVRKEELQDHRNPEIKFGGYLGILKKLLIAGFTLVALSFLLRLFVPEV